MTPSDDAGLDRLVVALLDACVEIRRESVRAEASVRDREELERFAVLEELRHMWPSHAEPIRKLMLERAEALGPDFAEWLESLLSRFAATEPPISLERSHLTPWVIRRCDNGLALGGAATEAEALHRARELSREQPALLLEIVDEHRGAVLYEVQGGLPIRSR